MNHDNTEGTVDLFPKYFLRNVNNEMQFHYGGYEYGISLVREWLTTTFYNGFAEEVKNAMKVQSFPSNGETLNDKVKCPSLNEVGLYPRFCEYVDEGSIYPIFGNELMNGANNLAVYHAVNNDDINHRYYWTRTCRGSNVCFVSRDGSFYDTECYSSSNVIACIRF